MVRARLDALPDHLRPSGSELSLSAHEVGASLLVELSTATPSTTTEEWVRRVGQSSHVVLSTGDGAVQVETPRVTGRTLWHWRDADLDIVSTSMRAAAFLSGSSEPDADAVPWMMVTGTLGPSRSWDRRIAQLPPGSSWSPLSGELAARPLRLPAMNSDDEWGTELERRLCAVVDSLQLGAGAWSLPLSGGVDSRGLAITLGNCLPAVTWGDPATEADAGSDLSVARRVASAFGLDHRLLELSAASSSADVVLDRFAQASECRTENVGGYVDGFQLWQDLRSAGVRGVVRGDEVFGWNRRHDPAATRLSVGLATGGDLHLQHDLGPAFAEVADRLTVPSWSIQYADESLPDYRDRLYRQFRCPAILAPLNQAKSGYVDVVNPFLADPIVELAMAMPARLRTDKRLFASLVDKRSRGIPFAERSSVPPADDFLGSDDAFDAMVRRLAERPPTGVPGDLLGLLVRPPIDRPSTRRSPGVVELVRRAVPLPVRRAIARRAASHGERVDARRILFRAFLVAEGQEMVRRSAAAGAEVA